MQRMCNNRCRSAYDDCATTICEWNGNCENGNTGTRVDVEQPRKPITPKVIYPGMRPGNSILDTPQNRPPMHVPSGTGVLAPN
jgi:hypothetical protein